MSVSSIPSEIARKFDFEKALQDQVGCSGANIFFDRDLVLKIERDCEEATREVDLLIWLKHRLPVPNVYETCILDGYRYLLMSRLPGRMLCDPVYLRTPERACRLYAQAIHMLQTISVEECPFRNCLSDKLRRAQERIQRHEIDLNLVNPQFICKESRPDLDGIWRWLDQHRPEETLVFTHGDCCMPNIFCEGDEISGFLDFGHGGIADPWQDIALAIRSLAYNLGSDQYTPVFLDALGVSLDPERAFYYTMLDELF